MADTSVLSDFEQPTASNRTEHGAATTRELDTPVKLITFSMVDTATSPFAHHKTLRLLPNNNKNAQEQQNMMRDKVAYLTQTF